MMDIFKLVLTTSYHAAVVGLVIILLKGLLKNKLNAQWHYLLWVVLLLKLLIPFGPESAVSLFNRVPEMPQQSLTETSSQQEQLNDVSLAPEKPLTAAEPAGLQVKEKMGLEALFAQAAPYIWACGAAMMLLWLLLTYYLLQRKLRESTLVTDEKIWRIFTNCKAKMGVERNIALVLQDFIGVPSLFGLVLPKILLSPAVVKLSDKELEYILLHELAHYQRRDVLVNYLLIAFQIVHWFNPVLWYCFKRIRQDMEVAADERVLSVLEVAEHHDYARALLAVLEGFFAPQFAPRLLGMINDKKSIESRLRMIKLAGIYKSKRQFIFVTGLFCLVLLGCLLLTSRLTNFASVPGTAGYNAESLFKHKTAYVGNNSKVVNLINNLPYAGLRKEVSLQTQTAPYGITVNYDFSNTNLDTRQVEQTFRNNAVIMFTLIDNADVITFHVAGTAQQSEFRYARAEVQQSFTNDLREYSQDLSGFETFLKNLSFRLFVYPEKYTMTMSSTPGIRLSAEYQGSVDRVRYTAEKGSILTWDVPSGKVSQGVPVSERTYGSPVYWSPLDQHGQISNEKENVITVTLLDEQGRQIAEKQVTILYDGSMYYAAKSSWDIVIGTDSPSPAEKPTNIDEAVSRAIKDRRTAYGAGETATEGHIILDTVEKNGTVTVYTLASYGAFGFENGIFTKVSGSGAIPTVITFSRSEQGGYSLLEYKEPLDGRGYTDSVKKMFPQVLWNQVLSADKYPDLVKQQEEQAEKYLQSIGRKAQVSAKHVERKLPEINVEASNKLFAENTKYNAFLNNCPYWLGTREQIEDGVRYIYETSQNKSSDGYDLLTFRKSKEDGTVVGEYQYKIVGSEPQLIIVKSAPQLVK